MKNRYFKTAILLTTSFSVTLLAISNCAMAQTSSKPLPDKVKNKQPAVLRISLDDYQDRVEAIWTAQMAAAIMGFKFEHHTASVEWVDQLPSTFTSAPVDDDWYYEMAAIRAFEKYGVDMTIQELGQQWKENSCGTWGSSEQTLLLLNKGILPPATGHPSYNKLWFSIGPQFSADVYGALAPGLPNLAAKMAREYGQINGYAEGVDGAVFVAGMISIGFYEKNPKQVVRQAAKLISPKSPYRKCIDQVIELADEGKSAAEIFDAIEDRWHIEYPATNNAVPNGGIIAASLWFGEADFLKTINLSFGAADFTDADCNAANAAAVVGAMHGMKSIPDYLVKSFGDRIKGDKLGHVVLTPAVDETISGLSQRTVDVAKKILAKQGITASNNMLDIKIQHPVSLPAELFQLSGLTKTWNPAWRLERAGFGGAGGGMRGIRGNTYLNGDVLATYPRDEVRALVLSRKLDIGTEKQLRFEAGVDSGRVWALDVFINNKQVHTSLVEGVKKGQQWQTVKVDLAPFQGQAVKIRLYQRVLIPGREAGNAYWKNIEIN